MLFCSDTVCYIDCKLHYSTITVVYCKAKYSNLLATVLPVTYCKYTRKLLTVISLFSILWHLISNVEIQMWGELSLLSQKSLTVLPSSKNKKYTSFSDLTSPF